MTCDYKRKTAMIFGVTGQDGSYLSEFLLSKGYKVIGVARRSSNENRQRLARVINSPSFSLAEGDVTDGAGVIRLISQNMPNEVYNLAAQSHVGTSFDQVNTTFDITAVGCFNILEAIRMFSWEPNPIKFYQAGSSEMFGNVTNGLPQDEDTPFNPQSPYAVAKVAAHQMTKLYRNAHNIFSCNGILFNHESPRRGDNFVTKKITNWLRMDFQTRPLYLELGNLSAQRDWGYAPDYVEAMWLMLQQDEPDDYVIATGETHTVQEFLEEAFSLYGFDYKENVKINELLKRPSEVPFLLGDATKAKNFLGWEPKVKFKELVKIMVKGE